MRRALVRTAAAAARATATATAAATDGSALRRFRSTLAPPVAAAATATTAATLDKPARRQRSASPSAPRYHKKPVRPRLRVADARVGALLASRTPSAEFVALCAELRGESEVELLAATDSTAWNVALQNRLRQHDAAGARALLDLLLGFAPENASEPLWSDLLFTLLRQRAHFSQERDVRALLATLRRSSGDAFVARVVVSLVNGCANIKMFDEARYLVRFYAEALQHTAELPPRVLGHLASAMQTKRRFAGVVDFADELLARGGAVPLRLVQPQLWIALFRSCEQTRATDLSRHVDRVIDWFHELQQEPVGAKDQPPPAFERVLGAAVQSCVASGNERLALRVFHAMTESGDVLEENEAAPGRAPAPHAVVVQPDENIYVNVLKACRALHDDSLFRDVYRRMVRAGVARSAGFGSAIRFCHAHHDVAFLEEVLDDAFAVEDACSATSRSQGRGRGTRSHNDGWFLPLEQYNDALGCLAETKSFDLAKELFARLLENPRVTPDEVTMVEMVENYFEAPFSHVFELMEVFLELQVSPNLHVFTSLLAACARHRLINDALALVSAMKAQGVALDIKAFTALAFVYATHGHLPELVGLVQDARAQRVAVDDKFFDVLLDGLYLAHGIDMCFALLRETLAAGLAIPPGMYRALLRIGTRAGLVERTLHVAYNMECDGIPLTSAQLLALMHRCEANAEVAELARTFLLLHQGRQALSPDDPEARFSQDVYEEMVALLAAFSQRDAAARVRQLGERAGYDLS